MIAAFLIGTQQHFNSTVYTTSVTVIPIFFITLAVELGAARSPVMKRMVALYRYRKLRRFESIEDRVHWFFRGLLLLLTALLPVVTVLGWAAEVTGLLALDRRAISEPAHVLVLVSVIALPTVTLFWALAMREREPTPFEEDLDHLAERREQAIGELSAQVNSMEIDAPSGGPVDLHHVHQTQKRLAALTRQGKRLDKSTEKTRRALQALCESERHRDGP
jgi:hypothetical protein